MSDAGDITVVTFLVRAPRAYIDRVHEGGVSLHAGIRLELVKPSSNALILRPREGSQDSAPEAFIEEKFSLAV